MKRQHPDNPNLFWCPKCRTYKVRGEFYIAKNSGSVASRCKSCRSEYQRYQNEKYPHVEKMRRDKRKTKKSICELCGVSYLSRIDKEQKYCSNVCRTNARKKRTIVCCSTCGVNIEVLLCRLERGKHFCSAKCRNRYRSVIGKYYGKIHGFKKGHEPSRKGKIIIPLNIQKEKRLNKYKERRDNCSDSYIMSIVRANKTEMTPITIELTRQRIIMKRTLKEFKKWRKENESDNADVSRK